MFTLTPSAAVDPGLQSLLEPSPEAVVLVDGSGTMIAVNRRAEALFARPREELLGRPVEILVPERARQAHVAARAKYAAAPTVRAMSARTGLTGLRGDGTEFPVEIGLTPVPGSPSGVVMAVVRDVSARSRAERVLAEAHERAEGILEAVADGIVTTDVDGKVTFLNPAAERVLGRSLAEVRGRPLEELLPLLQHGPGAPVESPVAACLRGSAPRVTLDRVSLVRPGGERCALELSATPMRDAGGAVAGVALVIRDVTAQQSLATELAHQATHDPLTGLVNRAELERRLARVLASARQTREQHALCFLDLDRFKDVNDRAGHQAGDELLRQLSALLREQMRTRDTLARVGGDEFAVLLEHCSTERAVRIAEALRRSVARFRFVWGDQSYGVGASIGIVAVSAGSGTVADVLRAADIACYLAKQRGRNRIQVYDPARRGSPRRAERRWAQEIRRAVAEDGFRLYAQPILPLGRDGEPPRWEVLLRLAQPEGEPLLPGSFLPAAERYGLMGEVDEWVIRHTVAALAAWQRAHPGAEPPTVALNLGRETIAAHAVGGLVRARLAAAAVPPRALCFEIAESALVAHPVAARRLARDLQRLGCRVTLEHCGSGIAVFTLLKRLRLDYLKIAGHIVRDVARDPVDRALAAAVNEVGHLTGYRTVAVEVADAHVLACVRELGVDYAQGFELGRPRPLEAALGLPSPA